MYVPGSIAGAADKRGRGRIGVADERLDELRADVVVAGDLAEARLVPGEQRRADAAPVERGIDEAHQPVDSAVGSVVPPDTAVRDRVAFDLRDQHVALGVTAHEMVVARRDPFGGLHAFVPLAARRRGDDASEVGVVGGTSGTSGSRRRRAWGSAVTDILLRESGPGSAGHELRASVLGERLYVKSRGQLASTSWISIDDLPSRRAGIPRRRREDDTSRRGCQGPRRRCAAPGGAGSPRRSSERVSWRSAPESTSIHASSSENPRARNCSYRQLATCWSSSDSSYAGGSSAADISPVTNAARRSLLAEGKAWLRRRCAYGRGSALESRPRRPKEARWPITR